MKKIFYMFVCMTILGSCEFLGMVEREPRECYLTIKNESNSDIFVSELKNDTTLGHSFLSVKSGKSEILYLGGGENFEENFHWNVEGDTLHVLIGSDEKMLTDWIVNRNDNLILAHYRLTLNDLGWKNYTYTISYGGNKNNDNEE